MIFFLDGIFDPTSNNLESRVKAVDRECMNDSEKESSYLFANNDRMRKVVERLVAIALQYIVARFANKKQMT